MALQHFSCWQLCLSMTSVPALQSLCERTTQGGEGQRVRKNALPEICCTCSFKEIFGVSVPRQCDDAWRGGGEIRETRSCSTHTVHTTTKLQLPLFRHTALDQLILCCSICLPGSKLCSLQPTAAWAGQKLALQTTLMIWPERIWECTFCRYEFVHWNLRHFSLLYKHSSFACGSASLLLKVGSVRQERISWSGLCCFGPTDCCGEERTSFLLPPSA